MSGEGDQSLARIQNSKEICTSGRVFDTLLRGLRSESWSESSVWFES